MMIEQIHTLYPEKQGFILEHDRDEDYYVFVHFLTEVALHNGDIVNAGACILYPPHSARYFRAENSALVHNWFHAYGNFDELMEKYGLKLNTFYYPKEVNEITSILQDLEFEFLSQSAYYESLCSLKMEELFVKIARATSPTTYVDKKTYQRFINLRLYLQENYHQIQSIEPLAQRVGLSPSRFYVLYKKVFGVTPKQDLLDIRLKHAKQLLRQKHYSVGEISEMVGYTNAYHFIRQFKLQTGETPLQFSKNSI